MEDVAAAMGDTPGFHQLNTPNDRELGESLVRRAEAAGYAAIVVTLDTCTLGWRPRDLRHAPMPQLQGLCLANYFSDPVFRSRLGITVGGAAGAEHVLRCLLAEAELTMRLNGYRSIADLSSDVLVRVP